MVKPVPGRFPYIPHFDSALLEWVFFIPFFHLLSGLNVRKKPKEELYWQSPFHVELNYHPREGAQRNK